MKNRSRMPGRFRHAFLSIFVIAGLAGCGGSSNDNSAGNNAGNNGGSQTPSTQAVASGITKIVLDAASSEAVTFGGKAFGAVGAYQKIRGTATGQLDPNDPRNKVIADIALAPKNANGMVEYSMDFYLLKPVDASKGNRKLFFEVNNRGTKQFGSFNQSAGGNNPSTAADAGAGFLMNQGYTLAWAGWDGEVANDTTADSLKITLPVAKNPDGSAITGPSYEYIVIDNATTKSFTTYYKTATTDTTRATLTKRHYTTDTPTVVPPTDWSWTGPNTIALAGGAAFQQSWIYELNFTAVDPYVAGIGFAAQRDFVSFLRSARADSLGTPNPVAGSVDRVLSWSLSQPARFMNDFIWLGFNQDGNGRKVFDGVFNWIGGGNGLGLNYRFAQAGRTERNRQNHLNAEGVFPFSYTTTTDPLSGKTDGRNVRCTATGTCPVVINVISGNEYWVKGGSLLTTDPATGADVREPANVRNYYIAGSQHGNASPTTAAPTTCTQFGSGVDPNPALRALFVALDQWVDGTQPPPSAVPSTAAGTAVFASTGPFSSIGIGTVPQAALGFPTIPKALYSGLVTVRNQFNFGSRFDAGILDIYPPQPTGRYYPNAVSKVDADGNDVAGIRLPEVVAPVATNTGWNLRSAAFGGKADGTDGCEAAGSSFVFAPTAAVRQAAGDPRPSLEERYGDRAGLVAARTAAANALKAQRLLLQADVDAYISKAAQPVTIVGSPTYGAYTW
ncbi:alpha/beta hydrolase domain-containing protein [Noviherbaspirillum suwonense]|uniref:Alpha/beta hydrolase domain-containing protein n=1 Tax=Noviherbaspirillum suwonense TaxID=1224511 RepID=A0ABY1Q9K1_9BURK|nr:alpha/beta hydrolase domain-containing protein [Noviherbaspirillum suwonense]SMP62585.1 hypothetical protein SAMN06295970_108160 [Noviherbaspirillum suwonense]